MTPQIRKILLSRLARLAEMERELDAEIVTTRRLLADWPPSEPRQTKAEAKRTADRIDGYDRDDLGESPDY